LLSNDLDYGSFYRGLLKLDEDLAEQARQNGCACGGKLHGARYPRKPRGVPEDLQEDYSTRRSFCCAQERWRKRTTPASFQMVVAVRDRTFAGATRICAPAKAGTSNRMANPIPVNKRCMNI